MSFFLRVRVSNFYKARAALSQMAQGKYLRGAMKSSMETLLRNGAKHAEKITHRLTGELARSHTWEYDSHRLYGRIYINPRIAYPRGGTVQWPKVYGSFEERRGGPHAFYRRTLTEYIEPHASDGVKGVVEWLDRLWR